MNSRILLDATCLMPRRTTGVGNYCRNLYTALAAAGAEVTPVIRASRALKQNHVAGHIGLAPRLFAGALAVFRHAPGAVLHGPDFTLPSHSARFHRVATVHDLAVFHPGFSDEDFRRRGQRRLDELLGGSRVDRIVTPSAAVQAEIEARFPGTRGRVYTVHHGCDHLPAPGPCPGGAPYFLFAGTVELRKNLMGIVESFEILAAREPEARLLLAGQDGAGAALIAARIAASAFRDRILRLGFVTDAELATLYAHARALVFPSLYEGFGFPVLEAMAAGCPVITSSRGALAEIAGAAARLVDPEDTPAIAGAMSELFDDEPARAHLAAMGRRHAAGFTWRACAERMLRIYDPARDPAPDPVQDPASDRVPGLARMTDAPAPRWQTADR